MCGDIVVDVKNEVDGAIATVVVGAVHDGVGVGVETEVVEKEGQVVFLKCADDCGVGLRVDVEYERHGAVA